MLMESAASMTAWASSCCRLPRPSAVSGPEIEMAATMSPVRSLMGAATQARPSASSSPSMAEPVRVQRVGLAHQREGLRRERALDVQQVLQVRPLAAGDVDAEAEARGK